MKAKIIKVFYVLINLSQNVKNTTDKNMEQVELSVILADKDIGKNENLKCKI